MSRRIFYPRKESHAYRKELYSLLAFSLMNQKLFSTVQEHGFLDNQIIQTVLKTRKKYLNGKIPVTGDLCTTFEFTMDQISTPNTSRLPASDHHFSFSILDIREIITFSIRYINGSPFLIPRIVPRLRETQVLHPCYSLRYEILFNNESDDFLIYGLEHHQSLGFIAFIPFQDIEKFLVRGSLHVIILFTICYNKDFK